jgi:hypothetical protein
MPEIIPEYPELTATLAILDRFNGNRIFIPPTSMLPRITRETTGRRPATLEDSAMRAAEELVDHRVKLERTLLIPKKFARGVIYLMHRCDGHLISPVDDLGHQPITGRPMPSPWVDLDKTADAFENNWRSSRDQALHADIYAAEAIRRLQTEARLLASSR